MTLNDSLRLRKKKTIEVPLRSWFRWAAAAKVSGVSRAAFIIAVCDKAAEQIFIKYEGLRHEVPNIECGGQFVGIESDTD